MSEDKIFCCPLCKEVLSHNYDSDHIVDLMDNDFFGDEVTDATTLKELRELDYQPAKIFLCHKCEINVIVVV